MDLPVKVPLKRPIEHDGKTYDALTLDEPTLQAQIDFAELEAGFSDPPTDAEHGQVVLFWIAQLAEIPEVVAGRLRPADLKAVQDVVDKILKPEVGDGDDVVGNAAAAK